MTEAKRSARRRSETGGAGHARANLLEVVSALMIETGQADVTFQSVAQAAGVTAPLLTYHFGNKESLLVALIERDTSQSLARLDQLRALQIDPIDKLRLHITGIIRTYQRYPYLLTLLNALLRGPQTATSARLKESVVMPLIEAQRAILDDGIASGQLRPINTDHAYFVIIGACQYLFSSRLAFADVMDGQPMSQQFARKFEDTAVDILLSGLRA